MDLLRHLCLTDFWTFFLYGFGAGANPKGQRWIMPHVHEPLARWFQKHVDEWFKAREHQRGKQKHLAILMPRECGKTTMITEAGQLWLHLRDPELSSYIGTERMELSQKILGSMKAVFDGSDPNALFSKLFGNWSSQARTWAGKEITHSARRNTARTDPSLGTFAVETSIVGAHPDVWFEDDPNSYERITTDSNWLATVNSQVVSMVPVVQSDGLIVWVGTRYDDNDHFGVAFREEGVASLSGMDTDSIVLDPDGKWHVYFLSARDKDGKPTCDKVWDEERLTRYQRRDPLRYAAQVMNDPAISEFNPITREQIEQCWVNPDDVPWNSLRFAILTDTAFSDGSRIQGKDETVMVVAGYPRNGSGDVYFVEGFGSNTWRAEDLATRLVSTCQRYRRQGRHVFAITDEKTVAGKKGAWKLALQNYFHDANEPMPPFHEFTRGGQSKAQRTPGGGAGRLVTAASFWVDGHVRLCRGGPGLKALADQMAKIGQYMINQRIKIDWADAAADAFQPELYQPMRRHGPNKAPWDRDSTLIRTEGLDHRMFEDDETMEWRQTVPREPIR